VRRSAASLGATLTPGDIANRTLGMQRQHLNPASFHGGGGKYD
jgi:hypothetical protein